MKKAIWTAAAGVVALGTAALGQELPPEQRPQALEAVRPPAKQWMVQFEPSAWYVSPGGKIGLPGDNKPNYVEDLNLDSPRLSPAGELSLYTGDWTFAVSGMALSMEDRGFVAAAPMQVGGLTLAPGDRAAASLDFKSFEASAAWSAPLGQPLKGSPGGPYSARLDLLGGARVFDVGLDVEGPSGSTSAGEFWAHPFIGAKLTMDFGPRATIDLQVDAGGFTDGAEEDSWSYSIWAGFMWRPLENVALQVGYRDLAFDLQSGASDERFVYRGALQGLYAGAVLRF